MDTSLGIGGFMKKSILTIMMVIVSATPATLSQSVKIKQKASTNSTKKDTINENISSSVAKDFSFEKISITKDGSVFVGGNYKSEGLMLKIIDNKFKVKKLSFIYSVHDIFFINQLIGWISDNKFLYKTIDGGDTWSKVQNTNVEHQGRIFFLDENYGWFVGKDAVLNLIKGDYTKVIYEDQSYWTIKKLQFLNQSEGWMSQYGSGQYLFQNTIDGGQTWEEVNVNETEWISDFNFINENEGFVVGSDSKVYSTSDKGKSWQVIRDKSNTNIDVVFFLDRKTGWIGGSDVCRTINGLL